MALRDRRGQQRIGRPDGRRDLPDHPRGLSVPETPFAGRASRCRALIG
jgi:hypothetical protein